MAGRSEPNTFTAPGEKLKKSPLFHFLLDLVSIVVVSVFFCLWHCTRSSCCCCWCVAASAGDGELQLLLMQLLSLPVWAGDRLQLRFVTVVAGWSWQALRLPRLLLAAYWLWLFLQYMRSLLLNSNCCHVLPTISSVFLPFLLLLLGSC